MDIESGYGRGFRLLLGAAALLIIFQGINQAQSILASVLIAVFFAILGTPPVLWLERKHFPAFVAVILVMLGMFVVLVGLGVFVGAAINNFITELPAYQDRLQIQITEFQAWLAGNGIRGVDKVLLGIDLMEHFGRVVGHVLVPFFPFPMLGAELAHALSSCRFQVGGPRKKAWFLSGNPAGDDELHDLFRIGGEEGDSAPVDDDEVGGKIVRLGQVNGDAVGNAEGIEIFAGDEAQHADPAVRIKGDENRLVEAFLVADKGVDQVLDGGIEHGHQRHSGEHPIHAEHDAVGQQVGAHEPHGKDESDGNQKPDPGHIKGEEPVDLGKNDINHIERGRHRHEKKEALQEILGDLIHGSVLCVVLVATGVRLPGGNIRSAQRQSAGPS